MPELQVARAPQEQIRTDLEEHGPVTVPFRYLLATWRLSEADSETRVAMAAALASVGVATSPSLVDLEPTDLVELTPAETNGGPPGDVSVRNALRTLEAAFSQYVEQVERAYEELSRAETEYMDNVARCCGQLEQASSNRLVLALEAREPVALYETEICTTRGEFQLCPDLVATVREGEGMAELELKASGWRIVERFAIGVDIASAQDLDWFASLVEVGVARLAKTKNDMAHRTLRALAEVGPAFAARGNVERAARSLVEAAEASYALDHARLSLAAVLGSAPKRYTRRVRRARKRLAEARETIERWQLDAREHSERVLRESSQAAEFSGRPQLTAGQQAPA